jgi:hypothetical protein
VIDIISRTITTDQPAEPKPTRDVLADVVP